MMLLENIAGWLAGIPPELATMIIAMVPLGELRGALPVALTVYKLPLLSALFWSILGNLLPVYFLLVFFERTAQWLRVRSARVDRLLIWLFARTRYKLEAQVAKYGTWALAIFVAIPLPATGAWTGVLAAFVFGLDRRKAFAAIAAGVVVSGIIVAAITLGLSFTIRALLS